MGRYKRFRPRYLGITVAEQGKAQRKVYDYLEIIRARMELGQRERQW